MSTLNELITEAVIDFRKVAALAHVEIPEGCIEVERPLSIAPHPKRAPQGKMAVYAFVLNGQALTAGKRRALRAAHGISFSTTAPPVQRSTLARSILRDAARVGAAGIPLS